MKILLLIIFLLVATNVFAFSEEEILKKAFVIKPTLDKVIHSYWPNVPNKEYFLSQQEQESCSSIKKCFNPFVELKTDREYGVGISQITVTYNADGSERFNNFKEAKRKYKELATWQWNDRFNLQYQLTYLVLQNKSAFYKYQYMFKSPVEQWAATFVAYNAGTGRVSQRRALCLATKNCNPILWFGGLNTVFMPGENKLIYNKSLKERVNEYPFNIIKIRSKKYICWN